MSAITHGSDAPNDPAVVKVGLQSTGGPVRCTGVLITPGHVMLAAHCVNGFKNAPWQATGNFGYLPGTPMRIQNTFVTTGGSIPQPGDLASYTPQLGKTIWSMTSESPINFTNLEASVADIAVIPIDNRVPWPR